jgi:hypothetical protein
MWAAGLTTRDQGISYQTASGCEIAVLLKTRAEVSLYRSAGDTVITNSDGTAGVKLIEATDACRSELRRRLGALR